jgi:glycosyltransferase involved in cell wall biosynthesis
VKLAIVVQRYGADVGGGSELHARYIAEHLAAHADVTVYTTCARDYVSWRNHYPAGSDVVNGIPVERFPVTRERDARDFARQSDFVFEHEHSLNDELSWLDAQGPVCPALVDRLSRTKDAFDFVLAFSLRYYTAFHAARLAQQRTVLVPTTERDPALGLAIFGPILRSAGAIMYNSPEERDLIRHLAHTDAVPGVTVGVGSHVPERTDAARARRAFALDRPFIVYVGRIDVNKGCEELFDYFTRYCAHRERPLDLVLIGTQVLPIPSHPRIRHLGYVTDEDKFDVIAAAEALVMPSPFESLSMVALEAWALGRPVLANGRCDVLVGQCQRSNAGLYYQNGLEFEALLETLLDQPALAAEMGQNGRRFYQRHYAWDVVEGKYLAMFQRLKTQPRVQSPEPRARGWGWLERRRRRLPGAAAAVHAAPSGPARETTDPSGAPS